MTEFFETDIFNYFVKPVIYIAIAYLVYRIFSILVNRFFMSKSLQAKNRKRIETSRSVIINVFKYLIILITVLIVLSAYHVDVSKVFAGLGIGVAVLSLAFQDIAKDFLAGISILLEDQFSIGDNVSINGFRGEVITMGLKTTRIRDYKGAVLILSNHTINEVINYSLNPSLAIVDLAVSYDSDLDKVEEVIKETIVHINQTFTNLKGKVELWGVEKLDDSAVVYRLAVKAKATKDFDVQRKLRKEFKQAFDKAGISIPFPQVEVHHGK